jgi:putative hydrolase of the HAD superfamily
VKPPETIIFDLDGTLYEDERVYDRYAEELARYLEPERQAPYLADWEQAKQGRGVARIGLGYDEKRDRLFRFAGNRILCFVDWQGKTEPVPDRGASTPDTGGAAEAPEERPPIEVPLFGLGRFNIGDWWGLPDALAAHYGVAPEDRAAAFLATRDYVSGDAFHLQPEPWLHDTLQTLRAAGIRLVAMSNSPAPTVEDVLAQLGIRQYFSPVIPSADKPYGLTRFLEEAGAPDRVLSIGDNYVNDIEPALRAGSPALYIDRHRTGLGTDSPLCHRVESLQAVPRWLARILSNDVAEALCFSPAGIGNAPAGPVPVPLLVLPVGEWTYMPAAGPVISGLPGERVGQIVPAPAGLQKPAEIWVPPGPIVDKGTIDFQILSRVKYQAGGHTIVVTTARASQAAEQAGYILGGSTVRLQSGTVALAGGGGGPLSGVSSYLSWLEVGYIVTVAGDDLSVDQLLPLANRVVLL